MSKLLDPKSYINSKHGRWTVTGELYVKNDQYYCACKCECGVERDIALVSLQFGRSKSCGCYHKQRVTKHGLGYTLLYNVWLSMKARCYDSETVSYHRYGGRGISVCEEWLNNPNSFYDWCMANGWKKGLQIDRENNDGNYEPSNCRLVTAKINTRNSSWSKLSDHKARVIKNLYKIGAFNTVELGRIYGVTDVSICNVINGRTWA